MKNALALTIGVIMIAAAILLAAGSSNQDTAPQPQSAVALATLLHTTPSVTPTLPPTWTPAPTETTAPTVTPIPGWTRVETMGLQLWLPSIFSREPVPVPREVQARESGAILDEAVVVCATCPQGGESNQYAPLMSWPAETIRLIQVQTYGNPELFPYTIANLGFYDFRSDRPRIVDLGRYRAYRSVLTGPAMDGSPLSKLLYWIEGQDIYWVIIFTAPTAEFQAHLAAFERIARSMTILR
ncbi:MAG: hypothetical protein WCF84_25285 [Anaerolineae bacterium]